MEVKPKVVGMGLGQQLTSIDYEGDKNLHQARADLIFSSAHGRFLPIKPRSRFLRP